jgi:hypothetical protein
MNGEEKKMTHGHENPEHDLKPIQELLSEHMAEVASDLYVRRQAVMAEVIGRIVDQARLIRDSEPLSRLPFPCVRQSLEKGIEIIERQLIKHIAEIIDVLTELAMNRGAGVPTESVGSDDSDRRPSESSRPPATAESLGGEQ